MALLDITGQQVLISSCIADHAAHNPKKRKAVRGLMMAIKDARMNGMQNRVNPLKMNDPSKVVWKKQGNRWVLEFKYGWKPLNKKTATNVRTSIVGVAGTAPVQGVEATLTYNKYFQSEPVRHEPLSQIQSENLNNFYLAWISGEINEVKLLEEVQRSSLGNVASTVWETAMDGIYPAQSDNYATHLLTAIGTNPAFQDAILPTVAQPIVELKGFQTQQGQLVVDPELTDGLQMMRMQAKTNARPILVGGNKWLKWHNLQGVMAVNSSIGVDSTVYVSRLDHDFYWDETVDAIWGDDVGMWIEPDSVCEVAFSPTMEGKYPKGKDFQGVYFDNLTANLEQYLPIVGMGYNQNSQAVSMEFDLRTSLNLDSGDNPFFVNQLDTNAGLWTRPTNFFTTDVANPLKTYTGICAIKIMG